MLILQGVLPLAVLFVGHHSGMLLGEAIRSAPLVGPPLFVGLLTLWLSGLLVLVVRPVNIGAMQLLEARYPQSKERSRLDRLWPQVLARAGVPRARYTLLVVDVDDAIVWVHRDLGLHVVAIAEEALAVLDDGELAAVLAQRLARQRTYLALLSGLCIWAALPLIAVLFVTVMAFHAMCGIGRVFTSGTGRTIPKDSRHASIGLILYLIGIVLLFLVVLHIVVVALAVVALIALISTLLTVWLVRRAELAANLVAIQWGYGPDLRDGMARMHELDSSRPPKSVIVRMADLLSTYLPASKHLAQLGKANLSPQER